MAEVVIPPNLAATVVAWEGDRGRAWLARLPGLVAAVAHEWDLELGAPYEPGGNISWVAPVRRADGAAAVLKLQHPHPESDPEAAGLAAWAGEGAVRLLAHDPARCALLLERCEPGHALGDEPDPCAAARVGSALGARLHAVAPPEGLPTLEAVLHTWADELEGRVDERPVPDPGLARVALTVLRERPAACERPVFLHGDLNPTNVLAADRERWLTIDPKPMVGDPAYDGPRLVTQPDPLVAPDPGALLERRLGIVAATLEVDRDLLAEWCVAGSVEMAVSAMATGDVAGAERGWAHVALLAPHLP